MRTLALLLLFLAGATLPASEARAAEPTATPRAQPVLETPSSPPDPPPQNGFTFGLHLAGGVPLLEAVPYERHFFATTAGFRAGYRLAPWIAAYVDGTGYASIGGGIPAIAPTDGIKHPNPRLLAALWLLSLPVALRPVPELEVSVAPTIGAYDVPVFGGKGHVAIPFPSGRVTYTPRLEVIALAGQGWHQIATTFGLGVDW